MADFDDFLGLIDEYRKELRENPVEREHVHDPNDFADSRVLLDDHAALVTELCLICDGPYGACDCFHEAEPGWVRAQRPERARRLR